MKLKLELGITQRELDVLMMLLNGVDESKSIAKAMHITRNTVKTYLCKLYRRLNSKSKVQLVVLVLEVLGYSQV